MKILSRVGAKEGLNFFESAVEFVRERWHCGRPDSFRLAGGGVGCRIFQDVGRRMVRPALSVAA